MSFYDLYNYARARGASRVIIIGKGIGGNPGRILFMDVSREKPVFFPLIVHLRGVIFANTVSPRFQRASSIVPLVCTAEDEVCEELAFALDVPYIGVLSESNFTFGRVALLEVVRRKKLGYVLKFLERNGEVGPKLLILRIVFREIVYRDEV